MGMKKLAALVMALALCLTAAGAMAVTNSFPAAVNGVITLTEDVVLDSVQLFDTAGSYTVNLNGHTVSRSTQWSGASAIFTVSNGAMLTINGEGTVDASLSNNNFNIAVWAKADGTVIINGGTFTNQNGKQTEDNGKINNSELIYASANGKVIINNGTFKGLNSTFMLNLQDNSQANITVNGGTFNAYKPGTKEMDQYDPSNTKSEPASSGKTSFVNPEANVTIVNGKTVVSMPVVTPVDTSNLPQTGDNTSLMLWSALLTLATAGLVASRKTRLN